MRKHDMTLMKQMKLEEEKNKLKAKAKEEKQLGGGGKISFDLWWVEINKKLNLPNHIKEIMWADFKGRGLKREELPEKYLEAINLFGYKVQ